MNFRITLSRDPRNRLPIPKPKDYRRERFIPIIDAIRSGTIKRLDDIVRGTIRQIPNLKADFNDKNGSPVSLRIVDEIDGWPEGDAALRARLYDYITSWNMGILYFIQSDAELAEAAPHIVNEFAEWGLPADEFKHTGHWPPVVYVREGRRMVGDYVLTEQDVSLEKGSRRVPAHADGIAIGDYSFSSHGTHTVDGKMMGHLRGNPAPFIVPYRAIVPPRDHTTNVLAPVPLSASHIAYCRVRMEPAWSSLGQAAGLAAHQAVEQNIAVQEVDIAAVQHAIHADGGKTIYLSDVPPESRYFRAAQFLGNRGFLQTLVDSGAGPSGPEGANIYPSAQWMKAPWPFHAVKPKMALHPRLTKTWAKQFQQSFPDVRFDFAQQIPADGRMTRGIALIRMYNAATGESLPEPAMPDEAVDLSLLVDRAVYREIFPHTATGKLSLETCGWQSHSGAKATDTSNYKSVGLSSSPGSTPNLDAVKSKPAEDARETGYFANFDTNLSGPQIYWTEEFGEATTDQLAGFEWWQMNAASSDAFRLALRVERQWYVTEAVFRNARAPSGRTFSSQSERKLVLLSESRWNELAFKPRRMLQRSETVIKLPAGNVTAFGIFADEKKGTHRFDSFTLKPMAP